MFSYLKNKVKNVTFNDAKDFINFKTYFPGLANNLLKKIISSHGRCVEREIFSFSSKHGQFTVVTEIIASAIEDIKNHSGNYFDINGTNMLPDLHDDNAKYDFYSFMYENWQGSSLVIAKSLIHKNKPYIIHDFYFPKEDLTFTKLYEVSIINEQTFLESIDNEDLENTLVKQTHTKLNFKERIDKIYSDDEVGYYVANIKLLQEFIYSSNNA
jgi:hypothetical protein